MASNIGAGSSDEQRGELPNMPNNDGGREKSCIWGGRFDHGPSQLMSSINASIHVDKRLYQEDIHGSIAHANMLAEQGIIMKEEGRRMVDGLEQIERNITDAGVERFAGFSVKLEDIHMNVEHLLGELVGKGLAGKLHTGRSRNDQIACDLKLWIRRVIDAIASNEIKSLIATLLSRAEEHVDTAMPGFTHLQVAQPVTLGHHLLAYVEMFGRDLTRFADARARMDECPLGAAALAGTSFPLERHSVAASLGFLGGPTRNSLDSVSDRDFCMEFISAAAICSSHLSRLAEEMILWATSAHFFNFILLSDAFSTGSSIMPQKRNPDAAELVRAKSGRITGNLVSMLSVMKALPLAYTKDLQEDKQLVFDTADTLKLMLQATRGMVADMSINEERMLEAAAGGFFSATDLADWMVQELGVSFREAHSMSGKAVKMAERLGLTQLGQLPLEALKTEIHPAINEGVYARLGVVESVRSRKSFGGTAPSEVKKQIAYWREKLENMGSGP